MRLEKLHMPVEILQEYDLIRTVPNCKPLEVDAYLPLMNIIVLNHLQVYIFAHEVPLDVGVRSLPEDTETEGMPQHHRKLQG